MVKWHRELVKDFNSDVEPGFVEVGNAEEFNLRRKKILGMLDIWDTRRVIERSFLES